MMKIGPKDILFVVLFLVATHEAVGDMKDVVKLADSIDGLAIKLFGQIAPTEKNVLMSPFSVSLLLNALLRGSAGQTAAEIESVLDYNSTGLTTDQILNAFAELLEAEKKCWQLNDINVATSLWIKNEVSVLPDYKSDIKKYFGTDETAVDFSNRSSTSEINRWIGKNTRGNVNQAFTTNLTPNTDLVLTSGNYVKSKWAISFNPFKTKEEPFFVDGGNQSVPVEMMYVDGKYSYAYDVDINSELVEIPFAGNKMSLVIVLPKRIDGIFDQEKFFTLENVKLALGELAQVQVYLRIPKFKISTAHNLNEGLKKLGIVQAFVPGQADLSKIDGQKDLSVSQIMEAGSLEIGEQGDAPFSTKDKPQRIANTGYDFPKLEYVTVDHPFGFLIRCIPTGVILFIGRVMSP